MRSDARRYAAVHAILGGAADLAGAELDAYLNSACGEDAALRAEVLVLLAAGDDAGQDDVFADRNIASVREDLDAVVDGATSTWLPDTIGSYRIVRLVGRGGMGMVYEALQESPRRSVAIKLLHPIQATADRLRRFQRAAKREMRPVVEKLFTELGDDDAVVGRVTGEASLDALHRRAALELVFDRQLQRRVDAVLE